MRSKTQNQRKPVSLNQVSVKPHSFGGYGGSSTAQAEGAFAEDKSRWNYSLSPGWTKEEQQCLLHSLQVFGVGRWNEIDKAKVLPSKTIQQMYLQTQRIIGQQSLAEFMGLRLDLEAIAKINRAKEGTRKTGFLINTDDKLTKEQKEQRKAENQHKFGLTEEQIEEIRAKLPQKSEVVIYNLENIINSRKFLSPIEKIDHLKTLEEALLSKLAKINHMHDKTQAAKPVTPQATTLPATSMTFENAEIAIQSIPKAKGSSSIDEEGAEQPATDTVVTVQNLENQVLPDDNLQFHSFDHQNAQNKSSKKRQKKSAKKEKSAEKQNKADQGLQMTTTTTASVEKESPVRNN